MINYLNDSEVIFFNFSKVNISKTINVLILKLQYPPPPPPSPPPIPQIDIR